MPSPINETCNFGWGNFFTSADAMIDTAGKNAAVDDIFKKFLRFINIIFIVIHF